MYSVGIRKRRNLQPHIEKGMFQGRSAGRRHRRIDLGAYFAIEAGCSCKALPPSQAWATTIASAVLGAPGLLRELHDAEGLGVWHAGALAGLGGPLAHPLAVAGVELAFVAAQRLDLVIERGRDIDKRIG